MTQERSQYIESITPNWSRRRFVAISGAAAWIGHLGTTVLADETTSKNPTQAIHFPGSFLYCSPATSGITVRVQVECRGQLLDVASGQTDEYVLGVVAKTGLTPDPRTGGLAPGYDYWIIFSKTHVFTRRSHSSAYLNNPTVLENKDFGEAKWRFQFEPAKQLMSAADVRNALENWREISARTTFTSTDGSRKFSVEYPVKWADYKLKTDGFRVETGPVFLLDANKLRVGQVPDIDAFQWAYFDYHNFEKVRCLLDRPTSVLADMTFTPPAEDGREVRKNVALTEKQLKQLRDVLFSQTLAVLPPKTIDSILSTDHYSQAQEVDAQTELFAFGG